MFLDELSPVVKELTQYPVAFLGGFFSGIFRLNLSDDPVKTWLEQQAGVSVYSAPAQEHNGSANRPQSITIE
jgi:hypothetical protein